MIRGAMSRAASTGEWQPPTGQERDAILRELHAVIASPYFCNSKRYPALLQYVVENTLAGKSDRLKERTLGVEVFDRPSTYDTNAEAVVRFTAGEVRNRLLLYYNERGRNSTVRISLPVGSYIPESLHAPDESDDIGDDANSPASHLPVDTGSEGRLLRPIPLVALEKRPAQSALTQDASLSPPAIRTRTYGKSFLWLGLAGGVVIG